MQLTVYMLPLITSAVLPLGLALFALRRPGAAGARAFVCLMFAVAAWSITYCLEMATTDPGLEFAWHRWTFVVGDLVPPTWVLFAAQYAGGAGRRLRGRRLLALAVVPFVSLALAVLGDPTGAIWQQMWQVTDGPFLAVRTTAGPWYWVDTAYSYLVVVTGVGLLAWSLFRSRRLYRQQIIMFLMGILVPWAADLATTFGVGPLPELDLTPMACTATAAVFAWGLFRFHFLDVMPIARELVFEGLSDPVVVLDPLNRVVDLNRAAERVLGIAGAAATGRPAPDVLVGWPALVHDAQPDGDAHAELTLGDEPHSRAFDLRVTPLRRGGRGAAGRLVVLRDITERKHLEQRLAQLAFEDSLTGLANRARFAERLAHVLEAAVGSVRRTGVLFLDLDDFKTVNDSLGHQAGDQLLVQVARRVRASLRPTDLAARLGGDEFAMLVPNLARVDEAVEVAERVLLALESPLQVAGRDLRVRASIGIALAGHDSVDPDDVLRKADLALYAAKGQGKARFAVFDASMERNALERLELETALRAGLERGEFRVLYQPIVSLDDGRIVEVEALVRWAHPERGLIPPGAFIPVAEETGLIVPLGQFVLETACRQVRDWQRQYPAAAGLSVAVNLSARQFQHPRLVADIGRALREADLAPQQLKLEITESVAMHDADSTARTLDRLKVLGIKVAIDDFGTGYSSLSYLKRFPVDALKIDRSFVDGLGEDSQDTAIVQSIVALARSLGVGVTGEGIETRKQWQHLAASGCQRGQGYYFSKPVPADDLAALLARAEPALPCPLAA